MENTSDMQTVLAGSGKPAAVPIWELEFHLWDRFAEIPVRFGTDFMQLSASGRDKTIRSNAEAILSVAEQLRFSAVTVPGAYWETAEGRPAYYWLPERARLSLAEILANEKPDSLLLVANIGGVLAMPGGDRFVGFSLRLLEDPDSVDREAEQCRVQGLDLARRFIDAGVACICSPSDIADNRGPFFNPGQMDRFILPNLREWASAVRRMGAFPILHTDGDVSAYLDALADSGIAALQAIDPVAGMDMRTAREAVRGRIALCGNVDCGMLVAGSPDEVHRSTSDLLLSCKEGETLVLGASNAVQREVPKENYEAMIEAWKAHGRYG
jgi:hypothetical protein